MPKRTLLLIIFVLGVCSVGVAQKPLPEMSRVGIDANRQRPLSLREALSMALENNKDIENLPGDPEAAGLTNIEAARLKGYLR